MEKFINDAVESAEPFVKLAILPEFVGKWFTKQKTSLNEEQTAQQSDVSNETEEQMWCYRKRVKTWSCDRLQQRAMSQGVVIFSCLQMNLSHASKEVVP